jgi:hypothetical protein
MPWNAHATRNDVDRVLRSAYPSLVLEDLDPDALDKHLPLDQLPALLERLSVIRGMNAVIEPEIVRSHLLHVGRDEYPDWESFNRGSSRSERNVAIAEAGGELAFWNILLSRVGPFWTAYWNTFRIRQERVVPELTEQPADVRWSAIMKAVQAELGSSGIYEVDPRLRGDSITWLRYTHDDADEHSRSPTIYDALFSDVY